MTRSFPILLAALILVLAGCGSDSKPGKRTGGDGGTGGSGGTLGEGGHGGFDGEGGAGGEGGEGSGGAGGGDGEGGAGGGDGELVVRSLRISSGNLQSATLLVSKKLVLTAEAFADGWGMMPVPDATIVWTLSNPDVATIESEGVDEMERKTATIRTLAPGLVTVVVTSPQAEDGLESTYDIEVLEGTIDDPLFMVDSLVVDGGVSCGISEGKALCWGDNFQGQSGTGSEEFVLHPPTKVPVAKDVAKIAPGATHGCAVDVDGGVHCWGQNWNGQLGVEEAEGKVDSSRLPLPIASDRIFRSVAVGQSHSCALDVDGAAWCWGSNWSNELGLGAEAEKESRIPAPVVGDHVFQTIVAGASFTCALDVTGQAWCWGMKASVLGIGEVPNSEPPILNFPTPTKVKGDHRFTSIDAGWYHICALDIDGAAWCWGRGGSGQIGVPAESEEMFMFEQWEPAQVQGGKVFVSITAGNNHSCGVAEDGAAWCWGGNETAALGTGDLESSAEPRAVVGGLAFESVSGGSLHSCAITKEGGAYCWGSALGGQLGTGAVEQTRPFPVPVVPAAKEKE